MRYTLAALLILLSNPVSAQQLQMPKGLAAPQFLGDMLAVVAFCNLTNSVDQYEMSAFARAIGITPTDKAHVEAERIKHYGKYRSHFDTLQKHQDFCGKITRHPFLLKVMRRGVPNSVGSDDRRQSEKIDYFGEMLAKLLFCNAQVDEMKWGNYLFAMGVKSESMPALGAHAKKMRSAIAGKYSTPQLASEMCTQVRDNLAKPM
ncbi:hypothetical protein [Hyphomicrobium sp. CS1BSMeth3]|uniref:hypothetical protein n=1 Tax=Hyphomicrobium sp. CS1BSMeth3 TaxID=1892844 RepID=UPI000931DA9D|nr:hypothetical protein [Hyphomicrobium sp. CS1BSMeth3]